MRKNTTRRTETEARLFAENLILTSTWGVEEVVVYEQLALGDEKSTWGISWVEWTS